MKQSWTLSEKRPTTKRYIERIYETKEAEKEIKEFVENQKHLLPEREKND